MSRLSDHIEKNQKVVGGKKISLREIHHGLMCKYGWINFEEFKQLPLPTLHGLLVECMIEAQEMQDKMEESKSKKGGGFKGRDGCSLPDRPR